MQSALDRESFVWEGGVSQVVNVWVFLLALTLMAGIFVLSLVFKEAIFLIFVPFLWAGWKFLVVSNVQYRLTNERLLIRTGVFNKKTDEIELYRVKDFRLEEPFFLRLFKLGEVILFTSDAVNQSIILTAISNPLFVKESLRSIVEKRRAERGVREIDTAHF